MLRASKPAPTTRVAILAADLATALRSTVADLTPALCAGIEAGRVGFRSAPKGTEVLFDPEVLGRLGLACDAAGHWSVRSPLEG